MNNLDKFDPNHPPPLLMTGEPGSFAQRTMTTRIPDIITRVLADYAALYPPQIVASLQVLQDELTGDQTIAPLDTTAPDGPSWKAVWQTHQGRSWLDSPWYFAESFFYRRLLEGVNYFGGHGSQLRNWIGVDPFLRRKQEELQSDTPWQVLAAALDHPADDPADRFQVLLHHAVWGNRIDLSYSQVAESAGRHIALDHEQENLLVDDTGVILAYFEQQRDGAETPAARRVDFICDNAGTELLLDLALADFLLRFDWAGQIVLHVKAHPTFVSDATPADVDMTVATIKGRSGAQFLNLATRLADYRMKNRLQLQAHIFWNSSYFFWEIPPKLQTTLTRAYLVIVKGDANYRRLLGDSRWPTTVSINDAASFFPTPFVALRTLKSDPIVGLEPGLAEKLDQEDSQWRVNGKRGLIQALL